MPSGLPLFGGVLPGPLEDSYPGFLPMPVGKPVWNSFSLFFSMEKIILAFLFGL